MPERARSRAGAGGGVRWRRRAVEFDQGVWVVLVLGALVLLAGLLGLFLDLDGAAAAASIVSGAALCGLAAVLFALASPRYVGTASLLAETLFDYTDAKARMAALELPEHLREAFRRLARGAAAESYLETVLRHLETTQAPEEADRTAQGAATPTIDAERIAARAVEHARACLTAAAAPAAPTPPGVPVRDSALPAGNTLDQPLPPA
ncbi:MAG: hypothetical protein M3144_12545 [Actinomycetota bacterium]|nr:hypothetical protein [Actinomycetota bacterium]